MYHHQHHHQYANPLLDMPALPEVKPLEAGAFFVHLPEGLVPNCEATAEVGI
ncbi:hypothetical protein BJV78DRAFT_1239697, partial [Lactifluus subvellereus]